MIAFDAASSSTNWDGSTTFSHTIGAGDDRILMITIIHFDNRTVTSCKYNGIEMTQFNVQTDIGGGTYAITSYQTLSPAVGTANIVVTMNTTGLNSMCAAISLNGVSQTTPLGTPVFAETFGGITSKSTDITTVYANSWLYESEIALLNSEPAITQDSGQTVRVNQLGSNIFITTDLVTDSIATPTTSTQTYSLDTAVDYAMHLLVEVIDTQSAPASGSNLMFY